MKLLTQFLVAGILIFLCACDPYKEPYKLPVYHAEGFVIGEEKCSVDSNYNYWLIDLSVKNTSTENGDSIIYNSLKYHHAFKALSSINSLHKPGNKIEFDFNFATPDHEKLQSANCDALNSETFLLIDINPFNINEIN